MSQSARTYRRTFHPLFPLLLVFALFVAAHDPVQAQVATPSQNPLFLKAQTLESAGKLEEARAIYDSLYQAGTNDMYFWKLMLIDERTGRYKDMERLATDRMKTRPGDLSVISYLSRALYGMGDQEKARKVLIESIGGNWKDQDRVRNAANELQMRNDLDGALQVYDTARAKTGNRDDYSLEIARLYTAQMRYVKAIWEHLKTLESSPATYLTLEQLMKTSFDAQTNVADFIAPLSVYLKANPKSIKAGKLLSMLKMRLGDYEGACRAVLDTAVLANVPAEIWTLANQMQTAGQTNEALLLYSEYSRRFKADPNARAALLKSASIRLENGDGAGAKRDYTTIVTEYAGSAEASLASLRLLQLEEDGGADLTAKLRSLADSTVDRGVSCEAWMLLGERYLRKGMADEAGLALGQARQKARSREEIRGITAQSALLHFFTGKYDDMTVDIESCVSSAPDDRASNDLLALRVLFLRSSTARERRDFDLFAHGRYALFRGADAEGLDSLTVAAADTSSAVAPSAACALGTYWRSKGETARALEWYDRAITAASDTTVQVGAMMDAAEIHLTDLRDSEGARKLYVQALTACPGSVFEAELRSRLRSIVEK